MRRGEGGEKRECGPGWLFFFWGGGLNESNLFYVKSKIIEQYVLDLQFMKL